MTAIPIKKRKQFTITKSHVVYLSIISLMISCLTAAIGYQTGKKLYSNHTTSAVPLTYALLPDTEKQKNLEELLLEISNTTAQASDLDYMFPSEILKEDALPIPAAPAIEHEATEVPAEENIDIIPELPSTPLPTTGWSVQMGSYPTLEEAEEHHARLQEEGLPSYIVTASVSGENWYRVRVSGYATKAAASEAKKQLQIKHQEFDYFIYKAP